MKPGTSAAHQRRLPHPRGHVAQRRHGRRVVAGPATTSTTDVRCAGFRKWRPASRSGRAIASARSAIAQARRVGGHDGVAGAARARRGAAGRAWPPGPRRSSRPPGPRPRTASGADLRRADRRRRRRRAPPTARRRPPPLRRAPRHRHAMARRGQRDRDLRRHRARAQHHRRHGRLSTTRGGGGGRRGVTYSRAMPPRRLAYMPGIDGLRALAVGVRRGLPRWGRRGCPAGFLGVNVFLVISGYLITSLLLSEHRRDRPDRPAPLLDAPRPAPAAGGARDDRRGAGRDARPARGGGEPPARRRWSQRCSTSSTGTSSSRRPCRTSTEFGRPSVFLPPLVAGGRGAVLPAVAAGPGGRAGSRCGGGRCCWWCAAAPRSTVLAWVAVRPVHRPVAHLLRHRHPRRWRCSWGSRSRCSRGGCASRSAWTREATPPGARRRRRSPAPPGLLAAMPRLGDLDARLYRGGFLMVALLDRGVLAVLAAPSAPMARAVRRGRRSCGSACAATASTCGTGR